MRKNNKNRRRKPKKRQNRRRVLRSKPKFYNIYTTKPKKYLPESYFKILVNSVVNEKVIKPYVLSDEYMDEFVDIFGNITKYEKKKDFKELWEILGVTRETLKKEKRIRTKWRNLLEMINTEGVTDVLEYLKNKFGDGECHNASRMDISFLQSVTILLQLGRSKHLRELTVSNNCAKIFCKLYGSSAIGSGEKLLILEMLSFLTSHAYSDGIQELKKRHRQIKERAKRKKEIKDMKARRKRAEKEKEREEKRKNKRKYESDDSEEEEDEEEEEDSEDEEDEDEEGDEDEYMKKVQARRHIKDDDLYDSLQNIRDALTSTEFLQTLSASLLDQPPSSKGGEVKSILIFRILSKLLVAAFEDRDHFDSLSYNIIMSKEIAFTDHFERFLEDFANEEEELEKEVDFENIQSEEEEESASPTSSPKPSSKINKNREALSYLLTIFYYLSENPSKKVHRKLFKCYDLLIQILQNQSRKYELSKEKITSLSPPKTGFQPPQKNKNKKNKKVSSPVVSRRKVGVRLDWSLITAICGVLSKLGGENEHLGKYFGEYLISDLVNLIEYSHYVGLVNMECYSCMSILLSSLSSLEMKQYLEDVNLVKFLALDIIKAKNLVERYYPPLLCLKVILEVLGNPNASYDDSAYAMGLITRHKKAIERIFIISNRIFKWMDENRKEQYENMLRSRQGKPKIKKKFLTDEEIIVRDKERSFSWPCLLTTINIIWKIRKKVEKINTSGLNIDLSKVEKGVEEYDRFLETKVESIDYLLKISEDVSKQKKKQFSYKNVLIVFFIILCIILLLPLMYSLSGGKAKVIPDDEEYYDDDDNNDEM